MISPLAYVDSTAKIGKNVTIQPFAFIEGNVEIGDDCIIMSGAKILHGTRMGKGNKVHHNAVLGAEPQDFQLQHKHQVSERVLRHIVNAYRLVYQGNFSVQDALQKIEDQVPMSDEIHNIINFIKNSKGIVK